MTSVAIRTAPSTSTISPPRTAARKVESGLFVVMTGEIPRRPKASINPLRPWRAGWDGHQPAEPVEKAAPRELAPHRAPLAEARRGRRARVVAVGAQRASVGLGGGSGE